MIQTMCVMMSSRLLIILIVIPRGSRSRSNASLTPPQRSDSCRAVSTDKTISAWMYYVVAMVYDLITTSISVFFLLKFQLESNNSLYVC